jgi:5-(carboxyamino)imidazole ribonucleotide synthase
MAPAEPTRPGRRCAARRDPGRLRRLRRRILDPALPRPDGRDGHLGRAAQQPRGGILAAPTCRPARSCERDRRERSRSPARSPTALDYVGVLTLEFFAGPRRPRVFNEMAPRVHNSGHWTIEGALTSQFENHIRAICGLPLGATDLVVPRGGDAESDRRRCRALARDPRRPTAHLHLYGKGEARPGRKMGHVTRLG